MSIEEAWFWFYILPMTGATAGLIYATCCVIESNPFDRE